MRKGATGIYGGYEKEETQHLMADGDALYPGQRQLGADRLREQRKGRGGERQHRGDACAGALHRGDPDRTDGGGAGADAGDRAGAVYLSDRF